MRISDWSSDVCSPDLPEHVQPCVHSCSSISRGCGAEEPFTIGFPHLPPLLQIDEMRQNGSARAARQPRVQPYIHARDHVGDMLHALLQKRNDLICALLSEIGRAPGRGKWCQYV